MNTIAKKCLFALLALFVVCGVTESNTRKFEAGLIIGTIRLGEDALNYKHIFPLFLKQLIHISRPA